MSDKDRYSIGVHVSTIIPSQGSRCLAEEQRAEELDPLGERFPSGFLGRRLFVLVRLDNERPIRRSRLVVHERVPLSARPSNSFLPLRIERGFLRDLPRIHTATGFFRDDTDGRVLIRLEASLPERRVFSDRLSSLLFAPSLSTVYGSGAC